MSKTKINRNILLLAILFFWNTGGVRSQLHRDSVYSDRPTLIHRVEIGGRPGYIIPTNKFLGGVNERSRPIRYAFSSHLKYAFQFHPDSRAGQIYRGAYQGIGFAYYNFDNSREIGNPKAAYLFQGATLAEITPRLSFDYEWNFGLSTGWNPYDYYKNPYNGMVGSKVNAYMNVNFYFRHLLSRYFDLIYGVTFTHFSNGNTKFPNAGLNVTDIKAGITYNINRQVNQLSQGLPGYGSLIRDFPRHVSYDVVFFGSWRRKGIVFNGEPMASPDKYTVLGFNINPMYNLGYKLRIGASLDGVYDNSANIYTEDYIISYGDPNPGYTFYKPAVNKQLALGLSARAEYVMPYFDVGVGVGANLLHGGGDLKGFYQILALKIKVTRHSFIHIGYNLQNFDTPNYLMLGLGLRLNNQHPQH
ncbi:acyloxyacyl hydrolase [Proteiniphilum sp. X52]|uniref:acyloxyacyl hydrolase n=1 Tax=Proteiniphilum sp. X52 TaxID=2382159 RepID=UPI000F0A3994|nr:acyloxyacyl hydrolase [Proteiniphilum sp. X52]RNC63970.1 acyloxyacyl hydrolase [Proteiniphilum sp. X52]